MSEKDVSADESALLNTLYNSGCITSDNYWIANELVDIDNQSCVDDLYRYTSSMIDMPVVQKMMFDFCKVNNFPTTDIDEKAGLICGNMADGSWLVNASQHPNWSSTVESVFADWCSPIDIGLKEKRSNHGICKCFNAGYSEEARERIDILCGAGASEDMCSSLVPVECAYQPCKVQDLAYGLTYDTNCPNFTICNIEFSGDVTAGDIDLACGIQNFCENGECDDAAKEKICELATCTSVDDNNCSGGGLKPDFCEECNKDPGSQACYTEMGIPCKCKCKCEDIPDHPFSCSKCEDVPQCMMCSEVCNGNFCTNTDSECKECIARCHKNEPEASCVGTGITHCDLFDNKCCTDPKTCITPECCSIDASCHTSNPAQSCYDDLNIPCEGPIAQECKLDNTDAKCSPYWMCYLNRDECEINYPAQSCYADAGIACEGPDPPITCTETLPNLVPCYGGKDCICTSRNLKEQNKPYNMLYIILIICITIVCIFCSILIFGMNVITLIISVAIIITSLIIVIK